MSGGSQVPAVRQRLPVRARREAILNAASQLFARYGLAAVSVDMVAEASGSSPALIHHYFGTKHNLVEQTLRRAADELLGILRVDTRSPASEQLTVGLSVYLDYVSEHSNNWAALLRAGHPGDSAASLIARQVDEHALRMAIRAVHPGRRRPPAALEIALRGWIALVKESCLQWIETRAVDRAALQTLLAAAFVGCVHAAAAADPAAKPALARLDPSAGPSSAPSVATSAT
jgi:AcrR family transcriptional regulator